jgi:hypothetical protein
VDLLIHFAASWKERPILGLAFERDAPGRSFIQGLLLFERRPRARFRCEARFIGNRIFVFLKISLFKNNPQTGGAVFVRGAVCDFGLEHYV